MHVADYRFIDFKLLQTRKKKRFSRNVRVMEKVSRTYPY